MALLKSGTLGSDSKADFFYGENDSEHRWIAKNNWIYEAIVDLPEDYVACNRLCLVFKGLDTRATVRVNDEIIAETDNMFHEHCFDLRPGLKTMKLSVKFHNMIEYAKEQFEAFPYVIPDDFTPVTNGEKHRNYVRKEQCSFSWDWGPCFLPCGIWKEAFLVSYYHSVSISAVAPVVTKSNDCWLVTLNADLVSDQAESFDFLAKVYCAGITKQVYGTVGNGVFRTSIDIPFDNVELWWPNGHGKQPLYDLTLEIESHDVWTRKIGFRTVQLCQALDEDGNGSSFYFIVNGRPIFAKGANFISVDTFESRVTPERLHNLVENAVDANMNMLRIWGGGIYQHDEFYDYCDQYGIMVWQEFMFACAMYPTSKRFLDSVAKETTDQMKRLMHHTSIVLWSGNNENEEALVTQWYEPVKKNPYLYAVDYYKLYYETIMPIVLKLDPSREFIGSSSSNGLISKDPLTVRFRVDNPRNFGDTHYYNYKDFGVDVSKFPVCRFCSEYGFQAFPWPSSFIGPVIPEDKKEWMNPSCDFLIRRNHHGNGQPELEHQLKLFFGNQVDFLFKTSGNKEVFSKYLLLTQIVQAEILKAQTEFYRRMMTYHSGGEIKKLFTMGALYWQFNDIWPAPTWAGIQSDGKWKLLHNYAKEFFRPLMLLFHVEDDHVKLYIVNDGPNDFHSASDVKIDVWDFTGTLKNSFTITHDNIKSEVNTSSLIYEMPKKSLKLDSNLVLHAYFADGDKDASNFLVMYPLKDAEIGLKDVKIDLKESAENKFTVLSKDLALYVMLDTVNHVKGRFHPNGFHLFPGKPVEVEFKSNEIMKVENIRCNSLYGLLTQK